MIWVMPIETSPSRQMEVSQIETNLSFANSHIIAALSVTMVVALECLVTVGSSTLISLAAPLIGALCTSVLFRMEDGIYPPNQKLSSHCNGSKHQDGLWETVTKVCRVTLIVKSGKPTDSMRHDS